ncbi:type II secretion system F family protein [Novosphingobium ginsenosidimutans]|uniref:Type II secretion system F family protein n=1 Tax=Novosphingobium ginsenosidimutans TaxID=1176536 RepID=A0A5B8S391_9SPHN|nr:type II secretion system F family protein [Novosphingobium ginsenosidimutans]QEA15604.1 type II secretion system F family protein [Novosphingobium ginsenosidimutans]
MIEYLATNAWARTVVLVLVFAGIAGVAAWVALAAARRQEIKDELRSIARTGHSATVASLSDRRDDQWSRLVDRIEKAGLSLTDTKSDVLRAKMLAAGFDSPAAPRIYTLVRLLLVTLFPALLVILTLLAGQELTFVKLYLLGSLSAIIGLYVPTLYVRARADRRREAIIRGFPDSLDLMLVCVEAGLGLEAALDRVGREMSVSHPLVGRMLTTSTLLLRAGASRETALRKMADTAGVDEIASFATLLIQSDRLGTSIAATLRVYADEMRERRRMRAEEKAHRIPVLISIPVVTCMLPVMIGVLMLPAAVRVVRQMLPAMNGG